jgi:hypothetical protein
LMVEDERQIVDFVGRVLQHWRPPDLLAVTWAEEAEAALR